MDSPALCRPAFLAAVVALAGCSPQPSASPTASPDTRAADEAAIRTLVEQWSASAQAKDAATFASFYAQDGVVMLSNAPDMRGAAAIREGIAGMMQDPAFALSFEANDVVVAKAGDLAYETGTYAMTMTGPDKKPASEKGHYVVVWRKQADGAWKVAVDAPLSDPAEAPAASSQG
jgi:uncharacterized protein (TIGR02246 family)